MILQTEEELTNAVSTLLTHDVISIDTETDDLTGRIVGISTYSTRTAGPDSRLNLYFPFRHTHDRALFSSIDNLPDGSINLLKPLFDRDNVTWVLHNYKFDVQKLWMEGYDLKGEIFDTMLASWMLNENTLNSLDA